MKLAVVMAPANKTAAVRRARSNQGHSPFTRLLNAINLPRGLYRTWAWRGPAAVVNRTGDARLTLPDVRSPQEVNDSSQVLLRVPLRIKKGSNRRGWLHCEKASAHLYKNRVPRFLLPEPRTDFRSSSDVEEVPMESSMELDLELSFVPVSHIEDFSLLPGKKFRVLVTGIELELEGAGRRELSPRLVWGKVGP